MIISYYNGAECPQCHSYMTFSKKTHLMQLAIFVLIFPAVSLINSYGYLVALLACISILILLFSINYFSKYKIDPAHESRLNSNGKNT